MSNSKPYSWIVDFSSTTLPTKTDSPQNSVIISELRHDYFDWRGASHRAKMKLQQNYLVQMEEISKVFSRLSNFAKITRPYERKKWTTFSCVMKSGYEDCHHICTYISLSCSRRKLQLVCLNIRRTKARNFLKRSSWHPQKLKRSKNCRLIWLIISTDCKKTAYT